MNSICHGKGLTAGNTICWGELGQPLFTSEKGDLLNQRASKGFSSSSKSKVAWISLLKCQTEKHYNFGYECCD
ncbi:unnamed protein product [Prunus armeniaca]